MRNSNTHPIRADFLRSKESPRLERLGMTFAPGKKQADAFTGVWDRDLRTDLHRLSHEYGVDTLISLLEDQEIADLQMVNFVEECNRAKIDLVRFPIRDVSVPDSIEAFLQMIRIAVDVLKHGETVVAHCKGGLGRAGTTAACIAVAATDAEISAAEAIGLVRKARPGAIETKAQELFVAEFENEWRELIAERGRKIRSEADIRANHVDQFSQSENSSLDW
jgi:protein-tyrosine phosphatase